MEKNWENCRKPEELCLGQFTFEMHIQRPWGDGKEVIVWYQSQERGHGLNINLGVSQTEITFKTMELTSGGFRAILDSVQSTTGFDKLVIGLTSQNVWALKPSFGEGTIMNPVLQEAQGYLEESWEQQLKGNSFGVTQASLGCQQVTTLSLKFFTYKVGIIILIS